MHWVHTEYWKLGPEGNDIQKTNVPALRMRFRWAPGCGLVVVVVASILRYPACSSACVEGCMRRRATV